METIDHYGIKGNNPSSNLIDYCYLQCILANKKLSEGDHINCGMPQGSILGLVSFCLKMMWHIM